MTDFVEPYSVVMRPQWNDTVAMVLPDWQVTGVSDPVHRVWLNPGVMMVRLTSESRFSGEVVFRRTWASADKIVGTLPPSGQLLFTIGSEGGAEMWINLSGIPNTNDQANTRITVTVIPMSGGGVSLYSLPSLFGGGRCERVSRAVRYPHDKQFGQCLAALAFAHQWSRIRHKSVGARGIIDSYDYVAMLSGKNYYDQPGRSTRRSPSGAIYFSHEIRPSHRDEYCPAARRGNPRTTIDNRSWRGSRAGHHSSAHTIQRVNTAKVVAA